MIRPPRSGVLVVPSLEALEQWPRSGIPIWSDLAAQWREELGLPAQGVIACGHQPWPFHPGIWAKFWTVRWLAHQHGGTAVGFVQDHAPASDVVWPRWEEGGLRYVPVLTASTPLRDLPPSAFPLERAREEGKTLLQSLDLTARVSILEAGLATLEAARTTASTLDRALVRAFRTHAGLDGLHWIRLQEVLNTESYRLYLQRVLADPRYLREVYNRTLQAYRREHRIRTRVQPFPDLQILDEAVEVPFWWLTPHGRRRVYMRPEGSLHTEDGTELGTVATVTPLDRLVPRAVPLMWITRYHLSDVFLHGLGGYAYDEVTDRLVAELWGVEPRPRWAVTLSLGLTAEDPETLRSREEALKRELAQLPYRAERYLPPEHPLRREKARLVQAFQEPDADRRTLHQAIKALEEQMRELPEVQARREALQAELEQVKRLWVRVRARTDRAYPFVFYGKEEVEHVLESAFGG